MEERQKDYSIFLPLPCFLPDSYRRGTYFKATFLLSRSSMVLRISACSCGL